ncbi:MAG: enoyl-CoA hydratase/isomerase family protein [Candidatus Marinimicrobia bacterium]|nr:enoyl-CoA hydratase/isomerase family protein [Candidatus Neomarinimicrobiota bacterium]
MNFIQTSVHDRVAAVTVDRPDALNAMNPSVLKELTTHIQSAIDNTDVRVIVLTGRGDKAFIAGADIKEMSQMSTKEAYSFGQLGKKLADTIEQSPKPVIAAVNGFALGGGCEISLACHFRFASEKAKFAQPEVKLGIIPGWGGTQRLPRIVGKGIATELIIGGHMIDAKEAHRIGLVNRVFSSDALLEETNAFAQLIIKNGPQAIAESLRCINESSNRTLSDGLSHEVNSFAQLFSTEETKEGLTAFVEKRPAHFR